MTPCGGAGRTQGRGGAAASIFATRNVRSLRVAPRSHSRHARSLLLITSLLMLLGDISLVSAAVGWATGPDIPRKPSVHSARDQPATTDVVAHRLQTFHKAWSRPEPNMARHVGSYSTFRRTGLGAGGVVDLTNGYRAVKDSIKYGTVVPHNSSVPQPLRMGKPDKHMQSKAVQRADRFCTQGLPAKTTRPGYHKDILCCNRECGHMCGYCPANALQTGFLPPECCADHIIKQKSCTEGSAPCWIDVRDLTMVPPRLMPLVRPHMNALVEPGTSSGDHAAHPSVDRPVDAAVSSKLAFVVWASQPEVATDAGATYTTLGKEKEVPEWTQFDADPMEMAKMIQLNFASARVTHPNCRLVILTDSTTQLDVDGLTPSLPGPPVELIRMAGMNKKEEMLSRMKARIRFLSQEKGMHHLIFLDTDMLVVKDMSSVFSLHEFEVGATWRREEGQPINGGMVFVPAGATKAAKLFFEEMYYMTTHHDSKTKVRRWFGTSDQDALSMVLDPSYGFNGVNPASPEGRQAIGTFDIVRTTFKPQSRAGRRAGSGGIKMVLFSPTEYNAIAERVEDRKEQSHNGCTVQDTCCAPESHVLHFKGKLKAYMFTYWQDACSSKGVYDCATNQELCENQGYQRDFITR